MRQETNNEMDLLLRRLGRSASNSRTDGDHLDADELSSYAENALPAAARARYTEHLAECASCRKLVAQLSSSVGVVRAAETAKVSAPSALRKFLASMFSPMVLRYAVPALGLIVVAVIGLSVWRRNETSVAQLREVDQNKAPVANQPEQTPASGMVNFASENSGTPAATPEAQANRSKEAPVAAPPPNAPPSVSVSADVKQDAPAAKVEHQQAANEPPAPKPTPAATVETQKTAQAEARKQGTGAVVGGYTKTEDRRADDVTAASAPATARGRDESRAKSIAKLRAAETEEKDKNNNYVNADTRSVAGRRFRKERGVWIDTAYDSSRSTVDLTRGSEQYRALVADEPAIKIIADQLDGEIIVVWKGRAYRIR